MKDSQMEKPSPTRRRFTLIEAIIVGIVMVGLVALLIPAVRKVRESAQRMESANHMKAIGMGMHARHNDFNLLPSENGTSVFVHLLPYQLNGPSFTKMEEIQGYITASLQNPEPIKWYVCPYRRRPDQARLSTDYGFYARGPTAGDRYVLTPEAGHELNLKQVNCRDGGANTIMLTHKGMRTSDYKTHAATTIEQENSWAYPARGGTGKGPLRHMAGHHVRLHWQPEDNFLQDSDLEECDWRLGAPFAGDSLPALFVDQSVRNIRYGLNGTLFDNLWQWNDGNSISYSDFEVD